MTPDEIARLRAENERLRAALAYSDQPCAYCSLPADAWAECPHGFPGCDRADDAMGCPHFGAGLEADRLREELTFIWIKDRRDKLKQDLMPDDIVSMDLGTDKVQVLGEMGKIAGRAIGEVK